MGWEWIGRKETTMDPNYDPPSMSLTLPKKIKTIEELYALVPELKEQMVAIEESYKTVQSLGVSSQSWAEMKPRIEKRMIYDFNKRILELEVPG